MNLNSKIKLLVYDGDCGLCHWAVGFLLKRLNKDTASLYFISSTSEAGNFLLKKHDFDPDNLDSLVVCYGHEVLLRAAAVRSALLECRGLWPLVGKFVGVMPGRDCLYNKVAKNRQKFTSKDKCAFDPDFGKFSLNSLEDLERIS